MKKTFKSTPEFFEYISGLLSKQGIYAKRAGKLFEDFTREWHLRFGDYQEVYDANDGLAIPQWIIDKIDAQEILSTGANAFAIDKICVTRHGEIDIHQDKSTLHIDKNLSTKQASLMMSVRQNPLKNIRYFVINTTAQDLSHYANLWKDQGPRRFTYREFCPDPFNPDEVARDADFWHDIQNKNSQPTPKTGAFVPRGPEQVSYIDDCETKLRAQLTNQGYGKGYAKGAGSLGKSVLDPVIMARLQLSDWRPERTKSPSPVSVSFYHSSKTINDNGWEEVRQRRAAGIWDEVIVVSGTSVIDREGDDEDISDKFYKSTSAASVVEKILECFDKNKSVLLITLYHHSSQIETILKLVRKSHKRFRFWARKRDECDWPCSTRHSSYAPALDHRTDSVITFGSSGTERWGDPVKDYGTNNATIHGPCLHDFSWAQAENAGLVKKLILITPGVRVSDLAHKFPELADKDGSIDLKKRVMGVSIDDTYPTAETIFKIACVAKAMVDFPQVKRTMAFASFVKNNMLLKQNWKWVCQRMLGRTKLENSIKNLYVEVMNDDAYNSKSVKCHVSAIKRAKKKDKYVLASCRLFNRGYNDIPPKGYKGPWLKHHAGFHIDARSEVNLVQEIWRFTRNDDQCDDPFAYYICPMIYNDLDPADPTWSETSVNTLLKILKNNKNIKDDFESIVHNPSRRQQTQKSTNNRIWIPGDFDPNLLDNLITTVAYNGKGIIFDTLAKEAHDWLLDRYLELGNPMNANAKKTIHDDFYSQKRFQPLYENLERKDQWREQFFHGGKKFGKDTDHHIQENLLAYKLYCQKQKEYFKNIVYDHECQRILDERQYRTFGPDLRKLGIKDTTQWVATHCEDVMQKAHQKRKNNPKKFAAIIQRALLHKDWTQNQRAQWIKEEGLRQGLNTTVWTGLGRIKENFLEKDRYGLFCKEEWNQIKPASKKRQVKVRKKIFLSKTEAAQFHNVDPSTVDARCRSTNFPDWQFV